MPGVVSGEIWDEGTQEAITVLIRNLQMERWGGGVQ